MIDLAKLQQRIFEMDHGSSQTVVTRRWLMQVADELSQARIAPKAEQAPLDCSRLT